MTGPAQRPALNSNKMTCDELNVLLGTPEAPVIVDVCLPQDHALDPRVVPGARRMPWEVAAKDPDLGQENPCVILCQKGLKLSQGVAAMLVMQGRKAMFLEGGMVAWAERGMPLFAVDGHPGLGQSGSVQVMSEDFKASGLLDMWTVMRFADPFAKPLFVEADQTDLVADRFGAGVVSAMATLRQADRVLARSFSRLEQALDTPDMKMLLDAHCARSVSPFTRVTQGCVILDALWSNVRKGAA